MSRSAPPTPDKLLAYSQLLRLPNVFTAVADVVTGYLLVHPSLQPLPGFACLALASCCLYSAGMVLNDVYDLEQDRRERPQRPLPSGRIDVGRARTLGYGLLLSGIAAAAVAGAGSISGAHWPWRPVAVAAILTACIVLYDALLKQTPAAPFFMGACRFLNILLGASTAAVVRDDVLRLGFSDAELTVAAGMGVYIGGVTMFARREARQSERAALTTATVAMMFGIAILLTLPNRLDSNLLLQLQKNPRPLLTDSPWLMLMGLLALTIARRCVLAIITPDPGQVQLAVKHSLLSLITLNAAVILQVAGIPYALGVFALVIPTMLLGRWVYST